MHQESTQRAYRSLTDIQCEVCGTTFHPRKKTRRFCSRPCYYVWWKDQVQLKFKAEGDAQKAELAKREEISPEVASTDSPRKRQPHGSGARRRRDEAVIAAAADEAIDEEDDLAWAERAAYWEVQKPEPRSRSQRFNAPKVEQPPLVLSGHGVRLRVDNGSLVVRNGFTHYPQKGEELRYFPADKKMPSRIIALDCDGSISLDVIRWLSEQSVPFIQSDWQGRVVSVLSSHGVPYDPQLREAQLAALTNGRGLELATQLIRDKLTGCQETLQTFWISPKRDRGLQKLERIMKELDDVPSSIDALRMTEARAALAYFLCWHEVPLRWKGTGRKPIPEEWQRAGMRQGVLGDGTNRHATHPVNAMLNYGYAVLESQINIAIRSHGLDPLIGYLHSKQPGRHSLVFDLMEPVRPLVERSVIAFVHSHSFLPGEFVTSRTGVCRLHPELAKQVTHIVSRGLFADSIRVVEKAVRKLNISDARIAPTSRKSGVRRGRPSEHVTS